MKSFRLLTTIMILLAVTLVVALSIKTFLNDNGKMTATITPTPSLSEQQIQAIIDAMTLDQKIDYMSGVNFFSTKAIFDHGIPSLRISDGPVGVRNGTSRHAVSYPASICTAATWDKELGLRLGTQMGNDCRARGVHVLLGPGVNICRSPLCGRTFEYMGEDPYLVSRMAVAIIKGIQSRGVAATVKHLAGNNQEWNRHGVSSDIDERAFREIYLPAFEAAVREAEVGAIMTSYNLLSGEYASQCRKLIQTVIKEELGFKGIVISDWWSTYDTVGVANSGLDLEMPWPQVWTKEKLRKAIEEKTVDIKTIDEKVRSILRTISRFRFTERPQQDLSIPLHNPEGRQVAYDVACNGIVLLKNNGLLPLDQSQIKTLAVIGPRAQEMIPQGGGSSKVEPTVLTSLFNGMSDAINPQTQLFYSKGVPNFSIGLDSFFSPTADGVLGKASGLYGEYFDNPNLEGAPALSRMDYSLHFAWKESSYRPWGPVNDYSIRWSGFFAFPQEGDFTFHAAGSHKFRVFIDEKKVVDRWDAQGETLQWQTVHLEENKPYAIRVECSVGKSSQTFEFGVSPGPVTDFEEATQIASKADAVILCVGFDNSLETEDMDKSFTLPEAQNTLIKKILAVNKNVVTVVTSGGNVDMSSWVDQTPALVYAWFPGQEGGRALADILFGKVNPSGKLPVTFERRLEDNPTFKSYYDVDGQKKVAYTEGVFVGYRGYDKSGVAPLFPFGYGLSYTKFRFKKLHLESTEGHPPVKVSFTLKNTGKRAGAEVAEVYVKDRHSHVERPEKELKGFAKVFLHPGEEKQVEIELDERAFSYYDELSHAWVLEPGPFTIMVNSSAAHKRLEGEISVIPKPF